MQQYITFVYSVPVVKKFPNAFCDPRCPVMVTALFDVKPLIMI